MRFIFWTLTLCIFIFVFGVISMFMGSNPVIQKRINQWAHQFPSSSLKMGKVTFDSLSFFGQIQWISFSHKGIHVWAGPIDFVVEKEKTFDDDGMLILKALTIGKVSMSFHEKDAHEKMPAPSSFQPLMVSIHQGTIHEFHGDGGDIEHITWSKPLAIDLQGLELWDQMIHLLSQGKIAS